MDGLLADISGIAEREDLWARTWPFKGLLVEIAGPVQAMGLGAHVLIYSGRGEKRFAKWLVLRMVCAWPCRLAVLKAFIWATRPCCKVLNPPFTQHKNGWAVWSMRLANPLMARAPCRVCPSAAPLRRAPPKANERSRVGPLLIWASRRLNSFVTCCEGQRMGIFAGSGVGKSVLMSMLARNTTSDVAVIGLIGERGREVQEFIEDDLGEEGLARSIVVVATSDEAALMRRQATWLTMALSEYFRDQGQQVLCMMDSITRFAIAQREIGLAGGEPPTRGGYTPTVFTELPRLLERAGPGAGKGGITGLFTVLVTGDDHNEPVADAVRGILDGHIVMERSIAEMGRYPAINVLKSISRTMPGCVKPAFLTAHSARQNTDVDLL